MVHVHMYAFYFLLFCLLKFTFCIEVWSLLILSTSNKIKVKILEQSPLLTTTVFFWLNLKAVPCLMYMVWCGMIDDYYYSNFCVPLCCLGQCQSIHVLSLGICKKSVLTAWFLCSKPFRSSVAIALHSSSSTIVKNYSLVSTGLNCDIIHIWSQTSELSHWSLR